MMNTQPKRRAWYSVIQAARLLAKSEGNKISDNINFWEETLIEAIKNGDLRQRVTFFHSSEFNNDDADLSSSITTPHLMNWVQKNYPAIALELTLSASTASGSVEQTDLDWGREKNKTRLVTLATERYLKQHKPIPAHGWRTKAHKQIELLLVKKDIPLVTIAKYSKTDLDNYENSRKKR